MATHEHKYILFFFFTYLSVQYTSVLLILLFYYYAAKSTKIFNLCKEIIKNLLLRKNNYLYSIIIIL